jgi:hypothetical protein
MITDKMLKTSHGSVVIGDDHSAFSMGRSPDESSNLEAGIARLKICGIVSLKVTLEN